MKKLLLYFEVLAIAFTLQVHGQTSTVSGTCNLNLTAIPEYRTECAVAFSDLSIPVMMDTCGNTITPTTDTGIFPLTLQGTTVIIWTYVDTFGGTQTQTQDVVIDDITDPIPDTAVLSDIIAECSLAEVDVLVPTGTDNCSGTVTVTNDAIFPITTPGTSVITWSYTDANGNVAHQTQDVIIFDFVDPVPNAAVLSDIIVECALEEADVVVPGAMDSCSGPATVTHDATFPITTPGTSVITWSYTDAHGNVAQQTQDVIVFDFTDAVPDTEILSDIISECSLEAADVTVPTATDQCSGMITATTNTVFPITTPGTSVITWTYTDNSGNTTSQTQDVILFDFTDPVPDTEILTDIISECSLEEADVMVPTATDNCAGTVTVTNNAVFPITSLGTSVITWSYTDTFGNVTSQTQDVIIYDFTDPIPDSPSLPDITIQCAATEANLAVPTATDNCSGPVTVTSNATLPLTTLGTTIITWTFGDASGNTVTRTQNITIEADVTAPTPNVTVLPAITGECSVNLADIMAPTASDCIGTITGTTSTMFPITTPGTTVITWTYADLNGNTITQTQDVIIQDTAGPTPDLAMLPAISSECSVAQGDVTVPTATDCSGAVTVSSDVVFPITTQGTTVITWTFEDVNGNTTTQTQNVMIQDNIDPTLTLTDLTVSVNSLGTATITATQLDNGSSSDNCGIDTISVVPDTFTCTQLGAHLVTVTVTDINGNTASATATVTVTDPNSFCDPLAVTTNEKSSFVLYPNPTSNMLYIVPGSSEVVRSATIYSLSGQVILQRSFGETDQKHSISMNSFSEGTYLLKLETSSGSYTKRVVKQNK